MYTPGELVKAASAIRSRLPELLGAEAAQVERELAELLDRVQHGEPVEGLIALLLAAREPTRQEMQKMLLSEGEATRYSPLPGAPAPPRPPKYVCPAEGCHHVWYRHQMGPIPACPVHRMPLVQATES
jgi:hypothetical protein